MAVIVQKKTLALGLLLTALAAVFVGLSAGEMEPWGSPAPTWKPLSDIEPRQLIFSEWLSSEGYLRIEQSGSYYLGENIDATGKWGIEIATSDVTIDLNGFALMNGFGVGIRTEPSNDDITRVVVRNGTISGWGSHGIELSSVFRRHLVSEVSAFFNGGIGIHLNSGHVINCVAGSNSADGINVNVRSVVKDCIASYNGNNGIVAEDGSVVSGCVSGSNLGNGIRLGHGGLAVNNIAEFNDAAGIRTFYGENRIDSNQLRVNGYGIQLVDNGSYRNVVVRNSVSSSTIQNYDVGTLNDVGPIGTAATATSPWANIEH